MEKDFQKGGGGFGRLYQGLVDHILKGKGVSPEAQRRAAFDNSSLMEPLKTLIDKVANDAYRISDGDVDAVKRSGKSEDEIFELVICGAVGQASRQYNNALSALRQAITDETGGRHAS
ncbi:hypothetical protein [Dinghuibacter silviterrae]|uniref:Alkylhydroperoxidase/carboxymuconolactone decarboxylase family protein YurZ n=1 Tax=Dinghuibacter silviterrae TaxID=1539049 RepID=A0A4R8DNR4_9BACT|nr:hypothetical protein [Dinghuibacter silviterrae]TDW99064.1 hypothetical protein EDB95_0072 [Dinghuibacter silviterrae]